MADSSLVLMQAQKMRQQLQACTIIGGPPPSETVDEFLVRIHRKHYCAQPDWFDTRQYLVLLCAIDSLTKNLEDADLEYLRLLPLPMASSQQGVNVANWPTNSYPSIPSRQRRHLIRSCSYGFTLMFASALFSAKLLPKYFTSQRFRRDNCFCK